MEAKVTVAGPAAVKLPFPLRTLGSRQLSTPAPTIHIQASVDGEGLVRILFKSVAFFVMGVLHRSFVEACYEDEDIEEDEDVVYLEDIPVRDFYFSPFWAFPSSLNDLTERYILRKCTSLESYRRAMRFLVNGFVLPPLASPRSTSPARQRSISWAQDYLEENIIARCQGVEDLEDYVITRCRGLQNQHRLLPLLHISPDGIDLFRREVSAFLHTTRSLQDFYSCPLLLLVRDLIRASLVRSRDRRQEFVPIDHQPSRDSSLLQFLPGLPSQPISTLRPRSQWPPWVSFCLSEFNAFRRDLLVLSKYFSLFASLRLESEILKNVQLAPSGYFWMTVYFLLFVIVVFLLESFQMFLR